MVSREVPRVNDDQTGRVDLHLHSYASNTTDYYAANVFSIPESYSDPLALYALLKQRGMTLVTLTDHNSIDGVKQLLDAGYRDVFISAEMTVTFPEDGCNIHVTIANVTEPQFAEANRLRKNIYEMIAYLDEEIAREAHGKGNQLGYFMTHPLMSTQNRPYGREGALSIEHIEKALLLCNGIEVRNGARTRALNQLTERMVGALDAAAIARLADRHDLAPKGDRPWRKAMVAGSDDHAGINPGRTWTEVELGGDAFTPNRLISAMRRAETRPAGGHGGPVVLAHSILKLLYDGSQARNAVKTRGLKQPTVAGPIHALLRLVFDSSSEKLHQRLLFQLKTVYRRWSGMPRRVGIPFEQLLEAEVYALLADQPFRAALAATGSTDDRIFLVMTTLVNRILARYLDNLRAIGSVNLVGAIKEAVALVASHVFVSLPYVMSFVSQSSDASISRDVRKAFAMEEAEKLVLVTDTFFEINGVSASIKRMLHEASRRGIDFTVVTCLAAGERERLCANPEVQSLIDAGRLKILASVANLDFPEYDGLQIRFPPMLEMLRYLQESGFTKMQISTPGIIGITGLLAAKTLQIETAATYHTSIPEYVENYTRDVSLEALAWKYMILFYHSVDEVLVPSRFIARLLHQRGLRNRKLLVLDRWVDPERFHPAKRTPGLWAQYGLADEASLVKFVYVGRIGVEKDLHLAAAAYRCLRQTRSDAHLIVIGDGPYRKELEKLLDGLPVTFTGFVEGEALPRAIASADVKLFPSTTDTWGNAPLEAQACGLPVVVSDLGGPCELMLDGVTGFKVRAHDALALHAAMEALMDPEVRDRMGLAARRFVEANRVDAPFTAILDSRAHRQRLQKRKEVAHNDDVRLDSELIDLFAGIEPGSPVAARG